jgi:hypothetical protein
MNDDLIIHKLRSLIKDGRELKIKLKMSEAYHVEDDNKPYYQEAERWRGKCLNLLKLRFGVNTDYYMNFAEEIDTQIHGAGEYSRDNVGKALGALEWVLDALESGLTDDLFYKREIILFSDLLEQANEFLEKGFNLIAAIYGRIVLETTINEFAAKNGIKGDSFEQTIIELRKAGIITSPFEMSLRANYKTGSLATHKKEEFDKLTKQDIKSFIEFIRDRVITL